jgi:hypothetical protein
MAGANCCFNMLTLASTTSASYAPFQSPALPGTYACVHVCVRSTRVVGLVMSAHARGSGRVRAR